MTEDEIEDVPQLSAESLKALQEFLQEQALEHDNNSFSENWQLSQFWYDEYTTNSLSNTALSHCESGSNIALISCPTLYPNIKLLIEETKKNIEVILFEYDKRFSKYNTDYVFYDYNDPLNINEKYEHFFDVIIVDPPFLSEECLLKTVNTINLIKKPDSKIILCTGAVMEELANKLLSLKKCAFQPKHKNNLANEFICLTNCGEIQT